jgi:hypothetical protein
MDQISIERQRLGNKKKSAPTHCIHKQCKIPSTDVLSQNPAKSMM